MSSPYASLREVTESLSPRIIQTKSSANTIYREVLKYITTLPFNFIGVKGAKVAMQALGPYDKPEYLPEVILLQLGDKLTEVVWTPNAMWTEDKTFPEDCRPIGIQTFLWNMPNEEEEILEPLDFLGAGAPEGLGYSQAGYKPFSDMDQMCHEFDMVVMRWNPKGDFPLRRFCFQIASFFDVLLRDLPISPTTKLFFAVKRYPFLAIDRRLEKIRLVANGGFFLLDEA